MIQYIPKAAVVAEIEEVISGLRKNCNPNPLGNIQECLADAEIEALNLIKDSIDTIEVKDMSMPALDNGNMPVERWKEACEAASCQANYRKSKGLTETCDDYFVDGVQWADEHPKKAKEVNLEKEINEHWDEWAKEDGFHSIDFAKHFFQLGMAVSNKAQKREEL